MNKFLTQEEVAERFMELIKPIEQEFIAAWNEQCDLDDRAMKEIKEDV